MRARGCGAALARLADWGAEEAVALLHALPRTLWRRSAIHQLRDVQVRAGLPGMDARQAEDAATAIFAHAVHPPPLWPNHARNAIVFRQRFIDERVIRIENLRDRAVALEEIEEEQDEPQPLVPGQPTATGEIPLPELPPKPQRRPRAPRKMASSEGQKKRTSPSSRPRKKQPV